MRKISYGLILGLVVQLGAQEEYRSTDQIAIQWKDYADFQKQELVSFSNFLFSERFYDRALLTLFQYLYRYPGNEQEPAVYYYIARCYEETGNRALAAIYYDRVKEITDSLSVAHSAATYRRVYLKLDAGDYESVLEETSGTDDPYLLTFRGYAHFHDMLWTAARQDFLAAEDVYNHSHYSRMLAPLFQAIDTAMDTPAKGRFLTWVTSLVPGGGRAYLNQWVSATGTALSAAVLLSLGTGPKFIPAQGQITFSDPLGNVIPGSGGIIADGVGFSRPRSGPLPQSITLKSVRLQYIVPPLVLGAGIYVGSIWKTMLDVDTANRQLVEARVSRLMKKLPAGRFLDFTEPEFLIK